MAQQTVIKLIDDLNGKVADETITFSLDGRTYEIDLTKENAGRLRKALSGYVAAGRKVTGPKHQVRSDRAARLAEIRSWARDHGYEVSDFGKIPISVEEAFRKARRRV